MPDETSTTNQRWILSALLCLVVFALSFFRYFENYRYPPYLFWDENYHIASAQKYLHGVFFMEPHPPLGKMLIALGEHLVQANEQSDQFIDTHYIKIKELPKGFDFGGYRFMSSFLGWLAAPLFFLALLVIVRNPLIAFCLSLLYVFDNALIVHQRSAMLEGPQLFFLISMILAFVLLMRSEKPKLWFWLGSLALGVLFGCLMSIKINSLVMVLVVPALFFKLWPAWQSFLKSFLLFFIGAAFTYCFIWQLHFAIASEVNPGLERRGYYTASEEYKTILKQGANKSLSSFPIMLRDSFHYFKRYQKGVPLLNLCKDNENGGPFYLWPIGARSINYRWERKGDAVRYLYLTANPVIWFAAFGGVIIGLSLILSRFVMGQREPLQNPLLLYTFVGLWLGYMVAVSRVTRVMYLYHYFLPLIFSFVVLALVIVEVRRLGPLRLTENGKTAGLAVLALLIYGGFRFYAPFTYYEPLTNEQVRARALLSFWDIHCQGCPRTNYLAHPQKAKRGDYYKYTKLELGGIRAHGIYQEWGDPQVNKTVEERPLTIKGVTYSQGFGVHAKSAMNFKLEGGFSRFKAYVGLPDYLMGDPGSVKFSVLGDNKVLWESGIVRPGQSQEVDVGLVGVKELSLRVSDGGDGINFDHGCWLEPQLVK